MKAKGFNELLIMNFNMIKRFPRNLTSVYLLSNTSFNIVVGEKLFVTSQFYYINKVGTKAEIVTKQIISTVN